MDILEDLMLVQSIVNNALKHIDNFEFSKVKLNLVDINNHLSEIGAELVKPQSKYDNQPMKEHTKILRKVDVADIIHSVNGMESYLNAIKMGLVNIKDSL